LRAGLILAATFLTSAAQAEVKPYPSCESDPTENDVEAAKGAYKAGQVSFQEADYDRALLYWEDAFRRDCTAVKLLLNIARAYELSGQQEEAVNALQTYVDRRPDAKDRGSVEKRIAKLQEKIDAAAAAAPADEPEDDEAETEEVPAAAITTDPEPKAKKPMWPVWITGGGAVVALIGHGAAIASQVDLEKRRDEIGRAYGCSPENNECPSDEARDTANADFETDTEAEDLRNRRDAANGLAGLGHLAGITGGILWWIFWTQAGDKAESAGEPATALVPTVVPGYQGLSFSGRF
jgi:tetratricopeptide (TPR) repeat protein